MIIQCSKCNGFGCEHCMDFELEDQLNKEAEEMKRKSEACKHIPECDCELCKVWGYENSNKK